MDEANNPVAKSDSPSAQERAPVTYHEHRLVIAAKVDSRMAEHYARMVGRDGRQEATDALPGLR